LEGVESASIEEWRVRVSAVFNRLLGFAGTLVEQVSFSGPAVVIGVRLRSRDLVCPCGRVSRVAYDQSRRRWRHVNFGAWKVIVEAAVRRVDCRGCGRVRTEWVPWARPGARHTTDFENLAGWLAQRMAKSSVAVFMRTTWHTVDGIVRRLVAAGIDDSRLDGLSRIGVDEIAYKKGRKFLTVVTDHGTGNAVWIGEGRSMAALREFYDILGPQRRAAIQAVSMDMGRIYREATRAALPDATICFDPFHVIMWVGDALDQTHLATPRHGPQITVDGVPPAQTWRKVRSTLRAAAENLDTTGHAILQQLQQHHPTLHQAWQLKESLRRLYRGITPRSAARYLKRWCETATASGINAFTALARRIGHNFDGITAAIQLGISNSLTEGLNAGIRLIQRRAHGYASLPNLIEMIYLCHGGIKIHPPGAHTN
jgi:transposase